MFRVQCHEQLLPKDIRQKNKISAQFDGWVNSVRSSMSEEMKREMEIFFNIESFIGISLYSLIWKYKKHKNINEFLDFFINEVSAKEIATYFLHTGFHDVEMDSKYDKDILSLEDAMYIMKNSSLQEQEKWKIFYLFNDAENSKKRLLKLIENFYNQFFIEKMKSINEVQENNIRYIKQILSSNPQGTVSNILSMNYNYVKDSKEIILIPCYFCGSITTISNSNNNELKAIFGVDAINKDVHQEGDAEIIEALKCISDEKRIKIVQLLIHNNYFGYEIAQRLNLANSTTSHHLSLLTKYGIINPVREDNKIYYEVDKDRIKEILEKIEKLLTE